MEERERVPRLVESEARTNVPEIILFDAADGPQLADFSSRTQQLDTHVSSYSDVQIVSIGELWRRGIGIPLGIAGNQLERAASVLAPIASWSQKES